jgi:hypothetical protein
VRTIKPSNELRVLFIGDSVTYGQTFTSQPDIFTSILARDLPGQLHRPVEVLNASTGGWAVGNEVGYLRSRGVFQSDLIVLVLNSDDLTQAFNDSVPGHVPQLPDHDPWCALADVWTRYVAPRIFHVNVADRGSSSTPLSDDVQPVSATLVQLDEARSLADRNQARLAIVYSPMLGADGKLEPDPHGGLTSLKQWAGRAGVPILDMTSAYSAASTSVVLRDAAHLTPRGHQVVAASIEQWGEIVRYIVH